MTKPFYVLLCVFVLLALSACKKEKNQATLPEHYSAFPDIISLNDTLICVFYKGTNHVSLPTGSYKGGKVMISFSYDQGYSWNNPEVLFDSIFDERDPHITELPNGDLICSFFATGPNSNAQGLWGIRSTDRSKSWSDPFLLSENLKASAPVRALSNGRLILGVYSKMNDMTFVGTIFSDDNGYTWSYPNKIADCCSINEIDIIELSKNNLIAAIRSETEDMQYSRSYDGGKTWTPIQSIGFGGHAPYFHFGPDSTLILGYRRPWEQTEIRISKDYGNTWSKHILVDKANGAYISMANINENEIIITYYDDYNFSENADIKFKKFSISKDSVHWSGFQNLIN